MSLEPPGHPVSPLSGSLKANDEQSYSPQKPKGEKYMKNNSKYLYTDHNCT